MSRPVAIGVLLLVMTLLLAACTALQPGQTAAPTPPDLTQPTPDEPDPEETMRPPDPPPSGDVPQELFDQILEEAAAIAGVTVGELEVDRAAAVTWNDASLGCPEPDQMYAQVLTDGYWVVLVANGQELDFRASQQGEVRLCPPGQGRPPIDPAQ
jgi:glucose/arabinose dehydrogenase